MYYRKPAALLIGTLLAAGQGYAHDRGHDDDRRGGHAERWHRPALSFNRVSTLGNYLNNGDIADETVSEIVAASADGMTLVYTDSPLGQIGFVDITDPAHPAPTGKLGVGGEPTSVEVLGNRYALVAVNTSTSFSAPGGKLAVVDLAAHAVVHEIDLGGQPDSVKLSPDHRYLAVAIENERDEDVTVGGVEGGLPQDPPGYLAIIDLNGASPLTWARRDVDLTGLAGYAPEDPEPEFVDVNDANEAVVTLQENNHVVIVDLPSGRVVGDFPAGTVDLDGVDTVEEDVISLTGSLRDVPREPDAVAWVETGRHGNSFIATANEGDLFGGSRGFSLFNRSGAVVYDSDTSYEYLAVQHGHYPESRSENKGSEPESIEFARFGRDNLLFVGSERGSFIAVYEMNGAHPRFRQLLPAPLGPEGLLAIPARGLLVASGEADDPSLGVRSAMMIYQLQRGDADYPQILSEDVRGKPIPWSALSGMVAVPGRDDTLLAVWDSYYAESRVLRIDASDKPAVITESTPIRGGTGNYDPEGIAIAPDRTLWVASEGNASDSRPNRLLQLDSNGILLNEIGLPDAILACRAASANRATLGSGFEGVAVLPGKRRERDYRLMVAQQRGWDYTTPECEDLDDDDGGLDAHGQPRRTRLWIYDPADGSWEHIAWTLADLPPDAAWVGLSEVTRTPDGDLLVLERDNRTGDFAALKTLAKVDRRATRDGLVEAAEKDVVDLLPALRASHGWVSDKPEGVAVTDAGKVYVVTDNDGVDDWSGETWFLRLGRLRRLFD
ncbi:MAG: esterase-like activity of phytase family protein [Gammaproteobacteria bacterium]|nr:esterase-like activity of phytase family protein [Gammaproteobacteria bacterium]